jgi:hypothetical protein
MLDAEPHVLEPRPARPHLVDRIDEHDASSGIIDVAVGCPNQL